MMKVYKAKKNKDTIFKNANTCFDYLLGKAPGILNLNDWIIIHNLDYSRNVYNDVECELIPSIKKGEAYLVSKESFNQLYM